MISSQIFATKKNMRFSIQPLFEPDIIKETTLPEKELGLFIDKYSFLVENTQSLLFNKKQDGIHKNLKIKFTFLKKFTFHAYVEHKIDSLKTKHKNQILLHKKELRYLYPVIKRFLEHNHFFLKQLKIATNILSQKDDMFSFYHQLVKKSNFYFFTELLRNGINSESPTLYQKIKDSISCIQEIENIIPKLNKYFHSLEFFGHTIEYSNLNYFLVNKPQKNLNLLLKEKYNLLGQKNYLHKKVGTPNISNGLGDLEKYFNINYQEITLETGYRYLKEYKTLQKEGLLYLLENGLTFENIQEHKKFYITDYHIHLKNKEISIFLFDDITPQIFEEMSILSQQITSLENLRKYAHIVDLKHEIEMVNKYVGFTLETENKDQPLLLKELRKHIIKLRKQRGEYFDIENKKCLSQKYKQLCLEYKNVSLELGKIKHQIHNLKTEYNNVKKIESWSVILQQENTLSLVTIPKYHSKNISNINYNNIQSARKFLQTHSCDSADSTISIFESLDIFALEKLCFSKENMEIKNELAEELIHIAPKFLHTKKGHGMQKALFYNIKEKHDFPRNSPIELCSKNLIHFYKNILKGKSIKNHIMIENYTNFETFINTDFTDLHDFENEMKKICYIHKKLSLTNKNILLFLEKFDGQQYQFKNSGIQKKQNKSSHYEKIWINFWKEENTINTFPIRILPELKISFLKKDDSLEEKYTELKRNRKRYDRFILTVGITENSHNEYIPRVYKSKGDILDYFKKFNTRFQEKLPLLHENNIYNIDFYENKHIIFSGKHIQNIPIYKYKNEYLSITNHKGTPIYKNLSLYNYDSYPEYYDICKQEIIDITTAKLIQGKIYKNGDISTYLTYKLTLAKRKIYNQYVKNEANESVSIECNTDQNSIYLNQNGTHTPIYILENMYASLEIKEEIFNKLQHFLENINSLDRDEISLKNINNLQNALSANVIGIICFLQNIHPGKINLRNFSFKNYRPKKFSLQEKVEEKILQKMSQLSQIPSNYKLFIDLQKKNLINQIGGIEFINVYKK